MGLPSGSHCRSPPKPPPFPGKLIQSGENVHARRPRRTAPSRRLNDQAKGLTNALPTRGTPHWREATPPLGCGGPPKEQTPSLRMQPGESLR